MPSFSKRSRCLRNLNENHSSNYKEVIILVPIDKTVFDLIHCEKDRFLTDSEKVNLKQLSFVTLSVNLFESYCNALTVIRSDITFSRSNIYYYP